MAKGPDFTGFGGYGPWPTNDLPLEDENPGGDHYKDGYWDRSPGGVRRENPSDLWLDRMVYPVRQPPTSDRDEARQYLRSINLGISAGNATGQRSGPSDEDK